MHQSHEHEIYWNCLNEHDLNRYLVLINTWFMVRASGVKLNLTQGIYTMSTIGIMLKDIIIQIRQVSIVHCSPRERVRLAIDRQAGNEFYFL